MKTLALLTALILAPCLAWGDGPGIDLSANNLCPGASGALSDGGYLDCAALAAAGEYVRIYATFVTAEDIPDLVALEGRISMSIIGDVEGGFWNGAPGSCLVTHGGAVELAGTKPTNGDPCGTPLSIREVFVGGGESVGVLDANDPSHMDYYFSVCRGAGLGVTHDQRLFGFEMRFDPAYSADAGGACGTCFVPVCFQLASATPISHSGLPTTTLTGPTGLAGVYAEALFNSGCYSDGGLPIPPGVTPPPFGCAPVPTKANSWGRLKTLYR